MVVLMDVSGSMLADFPGEVTFGDGSEDGPWGVGWELGYPGIDTDNDGLPNDSRLGIAKSVLTEILNSTGDIEFALERYHAVQEGPFAITCPTVIPAYANNLGAAAGGCTYFDFYANANVVADPISFEGFIDKSTTSGSVGTCTPTGAPGGDVVVDFQLDNQNELLSWIDGDELFVADRSDWSDPVYGHELRASGFTPLARSVQAARDYLEPLYDLEPLRSGEVCRPYFVVVVTDGLDTCEQCGCREYGTLCSQNNECCSNQCTNIGGGVRICTGNGGCSSNARQTVPVTRVRELCEVNGGQATVEDCSIKTYVIGLALDNAVLDSMAATGSTGFGAFVATSRDELAEAFSEIIEGSVLVEVCDGVDNDCDGLVDEGFPLFCDRPSNHPAADLCPDPGERVCNGQDDNCDGRVDEGFLLYCDRPNGIDELTLCDDSGERLCDGADDNCNGRIDEGVCTCQTPGVEICDGLDNDCDNQVDEDLTRVCGSDVGVCTAGTERCQTGDWVGCNAVGPTENPEVTCDGLDNDCNGVIDGMVEPCGSDVGECQAGGRLCTNGVPGPCVGDIGPHDEICDGRDNDCDTEIDEGLVFGGGCGSDQGDCESGTLDCVNGALTCVGENPGGPEGCDGRDNDCDTLVDEGNPEGGAACGAQTDEGECERGVLTCVGGSLRCLGGRGPRDEVCDGRDNDCDTEVDEGNPGGGQPCSTDTGECVAGTTLCDGGELICDGGVEPVDELCDGLDNDCDGDADEGIPVGAPCGDQKGECHVGFYVCFEGELVCEGESGGADEVCDGLDNDCDGFVDEDLGQGSECGKEVGVCQTGRYQCIEGAEQCVGEVPAGDELCDCRDNDCDGSTDEGDICGPDARCIQCNCALPCGADPEFPCPPGRQCIEGYCVGDLCSGVNCPAGEHCVQGGCVSNCVGVTCDPATRCAPRSGACVRDDCFNFPADCSPEQACIGGECEPHPCLAVECGAAEYCRAGRCVASCIGVTCSRAQRCVDGGCVPDACAGVDCRSERQFCDRETGKCVDDECVGRQCGPGHVCDKLTGDCVEDQCNVTICPEGQLCEIGVCDLPDAPGTEPVQIGRHVLATGGGGCRACSAPGSRTGNGSGLWLAAMAALCGFSVLRRGRRSVLSTFAFAAAAVTLLVSGCNIDPFCIGCPPASGGDADGGSDGNIPRPDASELDGAVADADVPDGCTPGAPELCNHHDDDCDGLEDEGIDLNSPAHCGSCENVCGIDNAFPSCVEGVCGIARCDVGYVNLNGGIVDGCEYACLRNADDDTLCDERDNDCDGETDEDVLFDSDAANCGACGVRCTYTNGTGECIGGACALTECAQGFYDDNLDDADGCEYRCGPAEDETCDGSDNDCDGDIDNGDPGGGAACGEDEGECRRGIETCSEGQIVCQGEIPRATEECNGLDDDCDGIEDEDNPGGGESCGESRGDCVQGVADCVDGVLTCVGAQGPIDEICDGRDNDCDGVADNGNPQGGAACGSDVGECQAGTVQCVAGALVCSDSRGPQLERCDLLDNDCDGPADEDFDLATSNLHCGQCDQACAIQNAVAQCAGGACQFLGCLPRYFDRNADLFDGCEVGPCDFNGAEICNGRDDDCDEQIDEELAVPSNLCNQNGICENTVPGCSGGQGWVCNYPNGYQPLGETLCDDLDNDCDGLTDESFAGIGVACDNGGVGACRFTGENICNGAGDGIVCDAAPIPPLDERDRELCNGIDDDCDGQTDESIALADMNAVHITSGPQDFWIFAYEASRPGSTRSDSGSNDDRACSNIDVLPWTNVTHDEAEDACCHLNNADGECRGNRQEWRLCDSAIWELACTTGAGLLYPYANGYQADTCNGNDWDCSNAAGDQDCLYPTASFAECASDWGALGQVLDLSGNVKEWTDTERPAQSGLYEIRGGAYNNAPGGLTCDFDFTLASANFNFQNLGFRCCYYE